MSSNLVLWIAKILLLSLEIFENKLYCNVYSTILMICGSISIFGSIIGLHNTSATNERITAIVCVTAQLNGILLYISVLLHRKKLLKLFSKLEKNTENLGRMFNRKEVLIKNKLIWFFAAVIVSGIVFTTPPLLLSAFEEDFNNIRSILIPFWYSCGGRDSKWIPCWEIPTSNRMTVQGMNLLQGTSLTVHIFAYLLSFTLYGLMAGDLALHMEIIGKKVDKFNEFVDEAKMEMDDCTQEPNRKVIDIEEELCQQILRIIKYKKFLSRCIAETTDTWKLYLSHYYGSTFLDVTLFLFGIIALGPNQHLLAVRTLGLVSMRLLMALIVAYYSQNISFLNEDFLSIMSRIHWYNRKTKFCKIYLQVLTFHQKSNSTKLAGIVELNLNCYSCLVKNIYTVLNLMYIRYGK